MKNIYRALTKQLNDALAGEDEEMHSIVKSGSIKVVDCSADVLTELRDNVTKKINPKHNKDEPVVLFLRPDQNSDKMVPYPGSIHRYPVNMTEHYASESRFRCNVPGTKRIAKKEFSNTTWNVISLDDFSNWDCEPTHVQSPPDYYIALGIGEYAQEKDPLWAPLTEAGAGNCVMDLVSSVALLNDVIEITLETSDEDSDDEDLENEDSGDGRDVRHCYWHPARSFYISLSGMTAHAEASRAMSSYRPFYFTMCEEKFTFNPEEYRWIKKTPSKKSEKSKKRGKEGSPSTSIPVSVYSFKAS